MTQPAASARQWCETLQTKLMAALDAAWELAETTADPAERALALAKAKACGQFAAAARAIAAIVPDKPRASGVQVPSPAQIQAMSAVEALETAPTPQATVARTALARLKVGGGRRGRI